MCRTFVAFALLALSGSARGGTIVEADLKSTDQIAWISYTGGSAEVYAGAFDVHDLGSSTDFTAYCVDLTHDMSVSGNVFGVDPGSFASVFSPKVAEEVGFLLSLDTARGIGGATISQSLGEGAVQLAIWSDIDPGFQATGFSSTALGDLYLYDQALSRGNLNGQRYGVGYLAAEHVGNLYQNLAFATAVPRSLDSPATATPEPSGLVLGLVGTLGCLAFTARRARKAESA